MTPLEYFLLAALAVGACYLFYSHREWQRKFAHQAQETKSSLESEREQHRKASHTQLDALPDGLLIISQEGRIIQSNRQAQTILGDRVLTDRVLEEALIEPLLVGPIREALKDQSSTTKQITLAAGSLLGTSVGHLAESHWLMLVTPVSSKNSASTYLLVLRDVSDSINTEQVRKDFVANASHELRTPLSIVGGYLENLLEDDLLDDPDSARHVLTIMERHVERLNRIVEDMLLISRLESGADSTISLAQFQMTACIEEVLARLEPLITKQDASIAIEIDDPELTIEGDRFYWTQCLFNLVENALKQNSSLALKINIRACQDGSDHLLLTISDNGVGIPAADLPYIFKRFFRVEKHHSQEEIKGTGLGLSIVKRAVEAHRGTIEATSTPGVETKFSIRAPLRQTAVQE